MAVKKPHLLLAGVNSRKIKANLVTILDSTAIQAIENEILDNVRGLFELGELHYKFALTLNASAWRQKVSRFYYGTYNVRRSLSLFMYGDYSTDSSDHKRVGEIPDHLPNSAKYKNQLLALREDRNLCDYDHLAQVSDLGLGLVESEDLARNFITDVRVYIKSQGLTL